MFGNRDLGYLNLQGSGPNPRTERKKPGRFVDGMLLWWGVLLPATALLAEANGHFCARHYFDPLPTNWHTLLFALVPFTNLLAWWSLRYDLSPHYAFMLFCNGMAVGVAILYSLMFLPLTHVSLVGIIFFGVGLLGLAPLLSLLSLMKGGAVVAGQAEGRTYFNAHHVKHIGHLLVLTAVIAVETPSTFTRIALGMAAKPESRQQGLDLLRAFGNQEVMLRACYERSGRATDIVGSLYESHEPLPIETARDLFYRVTGRTFNSFPIPDSARATMRHAGFLADDGIEGVVDDEFDLDPDIAGEMVSGVSRGLSVCKSEMTGEVDADAAVAKFDWYLNFNNKSKFDREIRTRVKIPRGGVVNRASLIVDGKEYEAQITVKSLAREIYRAAVAEKKNPLLISTCGTDAVLIQAFPVPPANMREVKLHIGVVAPLELDRNGLGVVALPQFEERNFQISASHNVTIGSNSNLQADFKDLKLTKSDDGRSMLSGSLDPSGLATGNGIIHTGRHVDRIAFYAPDTFAGSGHIVTEKIEVAPPVIPHSLTAVIDGSAAMGQHLNGIADAFNSLPAEVRLSVVFVRDGRREHFDGERSEIVNSLKRLPCLGGQVDDADLAQALSDASATGQTVLWIHGAQPISSGYKEYVQQQISNTRGRTLLYDMQIVTGPDQLLDGMETATSVNKVAHIGTPEEDLKYLFDTWSGKANSYRFVRQEGEPAPVTATSKVDAPPACHKVGELEYCTFGTPSPSASAHAVPAGANLAMPELAQLMAYDRILTDLNNGDDNSKREAIELADRYHIVTPMSSAVLVTDIPELRCVYPGRAGQNQTNIVDSCRDVTLNFLRSLKNNIARDANTFDGERATSRQSRCDMEEVSAEKRLAKDAGREQAPDSLDTLGGRSSRGQKADIEKLESKKQSSQSTDSQLNDNDSYPIRGPGDVRFYDYHPRFPAAASLGPAGKESNKQKGQLTEGYPLPSAASPSPTPMPVSRVACKPNAHRLAVPMEGSSSSEPRSTDEISSASGDKVFPQSPAGFAPKTNSAAGQKESAQRPTAGMLSDQSASGSYGQAGGSVGIAMGGKSEVASNWAPAPAAQPVPPSSGNHKNGLSASTGFASSPYPSSGPFGSTAATGNQRNNTGNFTGAQTLQGANANAPQRAKSPVDDSPLVSDFRSVPQGELNRPARPSQMSANEQSTRSTSVVLNGATNGTMAPSAVDKKSAEEAPAEAPLVPESDTYLLLAAAMGVLGLVIWRNRRVTPKA